MIVGGLTRRGLLAGSAALLAGCVRPPSDDGAVAAPGPYRIGGATTARPAAGSTPVDRRLDRMRALARRRGEALLAGDEATFLADLDPSDAELAAGQRLLMRNLRRFDLDLVEFRVLDGQFEGATSSDDVSLYQAVRLGVDAGDAGVATGDAMVWSVDESGGRPVIRRIRPAFSGPGRASGPPWGSTELAVQRAGNVWVCADSTVPDLGRIAGAAVAEEPLVRSLWGGRPTMPGSVVFVTSDDALFETWFVHGSGGEADGVALLPTAVDRQGVPVRDDAPAARIVIDLRRMRGSADPDLELRTTLRHELAHALTGRRTARPERSSSADLNRWAVEGFARYVEWIDRPGLRRGSVQELRRGVARGWFDGRPPAASALLRGDRVTFAYEVSGSIFAYAEQRAGRGSAVEFYARAQRVVDDPQHPADASPEVDAACRELFGQAAPAFFRDWGAYARRW